LGDGKETEIEYWERVRAHLSTTALFSESHIGEIWGSHEANLVYRKRKEWELTLNEWWFLIRTYFGDASSVVPGWYWLFGRDIAEIEGILFSLSEHDHNTSVRKGALLALAQSNTCPPLELISKLLKDEDEKVVIACLKLLRFCEDIKALKLLEPLLSHPTEEVKDLALSAYIDLLYLHDPEQSFVILKDKSKAVTPAYKVSGEKLNLNISKPLLISAVFEAAPRVREFAAGYLSKVGSLTKEISEQILKDPDSLVRRIGFEWLLKNGEEFSLSDISKLFPRPKTPPSLLALSRPEVTEDDVVPLVLSKKTKEELEDMVDFYIGHGSEAYEALASTHTPYVAERLRFDLKDHFESLRNKSIDRLKSQYGEQAPILLGRYKPDTEQFIRDTFTASAIKGLAKLDDKSDINIAREYIGKVKYGMADDSCMSIIEKYGDTTDVERLIDAAKKTYGSTKERAVSVAIKLSGNSEKIIEELVKSQDKIISEIAAGQILSLGMEGGVALAKELLYSENDNVRLLAARIISKNLDRNDVEQILNGYIEGATYYYNVVHSLDRYLYAPSKFKSSPSGGFDKIESF
jgi:HEAT repeat protein